MLEHFVHCVRESARLFAIVLTPKCEKGELASHISWLRLEPCAYCKESVLYLCANRLALRGQGGVSFPLRWDSCIGA